MHTFYKTLQDFEFSEETLRGGEKKSKKPPRTEVKFKLPFIVDVHQWALFWFPTKHDGVFRVHALRHVKYTTRLSLCVRVSDSLGELSAEAHLYARIDLLS